MPSKRLHKTQISLPAELTFEQLPPLNIHGSRLPEQIDISRVTLTIIGPGGRPRTIDITNTLSDTELMLLEDEIQEALDNESS